MNPIQLFYDQGAELHEQFEDAAIQDEKRFPILNAFRSMERDILNQCSKKNVLYFATGSGSDIVQLAKNQNSVLTLDFSREMIRRTEERLKKESIPYTIVDSITANHSPNTLVSILHADIADVEFEPDSFDECFCYCTLPLLGNDALPTLTKLVKAAHHGTVSVYDIEKLPVLRDYYEQFGFHAQLDHDILTLDGGFRYQSIPKTQIMSVLQAKRPIMTMQLELGKIYQWQPR